MRDGQRTKARIEAEALRLFALNGVDGTSIRAIASAVGVAEGALYRHFPSKESLSRAIFLKGYGDLAASIGKAGLEAPDLAGAVRRVIGIFCSLFDEDRSLFSFLLLSQHTHLDDVPAGDDHNVVDAVRRIFADALARREIPDQDIDQLTAMALGIVGQPATFTIYGRLGGPMGERAAALTSAVLAVARSGRQLP